MVGTPAAVEPTPTAAWRMLALGVGAQAAGSFLVSVPAYLIPHLLRTQGLPLAQAGLLAAAPNVGTMLTLVAWGILVDRHGERWILAGGLALAGLVTLAAVPTHGYVWLGLLLALAGAALASTNAASGRVVVGWFPRHRRGLAMGIRQMAQPLGVAIAALVIPPLAAHHGVGAPLLVAAVATLVVAVACAVGVRNPPRPGGTAAPVPTNPYVHNTFLPRVHVVSALLVFPQFTLSIFGLVWLTAGMGWNATLAGGVVAASQFVGALGRIGVGVLSDRVGSRVRVLRWVALSGVATMVGLGLTGVLRWDIAGAVMLIAAATISVADNGLAFTSVAEAAGPFWSGRALGIQNTGQFLAASAVGPAIGALITVVGYPVAFALVGLAPLASLSLIPARDQHWT